MQTAVNEIPSYYGHNGRFNPICLIKEEKMDFAYGDEKIAIDLKSINLSPDPSIIGEITISEQTRAVDHALKHQLSGFTLKTKPEEKWD
jgi:hypothetical protein